MIRFAVYPYSLCLVSASFVASDPMTDGFRSTPPGISRSGLRSGCVPPRRHVSSLFVRESRNRTEIYLALRADKPSSSAGRCERNREGNSKRLKTMYRSSGRRGRADDATIGLYPGTRQM
ncbi:hypothetical protein FA13DRAFT_1741460 [Coprinellus micaceus]|uniref:Uncharacterized protein n=1 Tax=Coprinellus micaceus TaxID=71717 RepID=A0A4Y7SJB8_COPMI|nr:hypothetical protein FA13DRAFT_1741460 [Coprinellus micaceus]